MSINLNLNASVSLGNPFGHGAGAEIGAHFRETVRAHSERGPGDCGRGPERGPEHGCGPERGRWGGPEHGGPEHGRWGGPEHGGPEHGRWGGPEHCGPEHGRWGGPEHGCGPEHGWGGPGFGGPGFGGPGFGGPCFGGPGRPGDPGCHPAGGPAECGTPSRGGLQVDSKDNTVNDGQYTYKASTANGGQLQIIDNSTGKVIDTVWGDPHINTANGGTANFQNGPVTFKMPNGTQVTMTPTAQPPGQSGKPEYLKNVSISTANGSTAEINYSSQPGQGVSTTDIGRLDPGVRAAESQGSTPFYVSQNGNLFDPQTGVSVTNKAVSGNIA